MDFAQPLIFCIDILQILEFFAKYLKLLNFNDLQILRAYHI